MSHDHRSKLTSAMWPDFISFSPQRDIDLLPSVFLSRTLEETDVAFRGEKSRAKPSSRSKWSPPRPRPEMLSGISCFIPLLCSDYIWRKTRRKNTEEWKNPSIPPKLYLRKTHHVLLPVMFSRLFQELFIFYVFVTSHFFSFQVEPVPSFYGGKRVKIHQLKRYICQDSMGFVRNC